MMKAGAAPFPSVSVLSREAAKRQRIRPCKAGEAAASDKEPKGLDCDYLESQFIPSNMGPENVSVPPVVAEEIRKVAPH